MSGMGENRPLIVGVDPGTTTAVALLDLEGNVVLTRSKKGFSLPELREFVLQYGTPLLVCNDASPVQKAAARIAASFEAKTFFPAEPVSRREKRLLLKEYREKHNIVLENEHERDATFSAILAWLAYRDVFERVDNRVAKMGLDAAVADRVKSGVIRREGNITNQIRLFLSAKK